MENRAALPDCFLKTCSEIAFDTLESVCYTDGV